jgi:hypothetical protein
LAGREPPHVSDICEFGWLLHGSPDGDSKIYCAILCFLSLDRSALVDVPILWGSHRFIRISRFARLRAILLIIYFLLVHPIQKDIIEG